MCKTPFLLSTLPSLAKAPLPLVDTIHSRLEYVTYGVEATVKGNSIRTDYLRHDNARLSRFFYYSSAKLKQYRPRTAQLLLSMAEVCPVDTAYYAAFVFIYLRVWSEASDRKPVQALRRADLEVFTFFEHVQGNRQALALFDELLWCYQAEELESKTWLKPRLH